jgi:predicted TIM-barrel enzyme
MTTEKLPKIIVSLHLPRIRQGDKICISKIEEFALKNSELFIECGINAILLQDRSFDQSVARPEIVALMAAVGRTLKHEYPQIELGIIIGAHDPIATLAIAQACDASFVRLKVFVGSMLKMTGIQEGCGVQAIDYRNILGRNDIQILADIHDRTGFPLMNIPLAHAANWATNIGADALILTGGTFIESIKYLKDVQQSGVNKPLYLGGGITTENVKQAFQYADGVIVSRSLMKRDYNPGDGLQWDKETILRFMQAI